MPTTGFFAFLNRQSVRFGSRASPKRNPDQRIPAIKDILEELPKLTEEEKRQLWNVLDHELTPKEDEESPEVLAAIDEGIRSLENGEKTYGRPHLG